MGPAPSDSVRRSRRTVSIPVRGDARPRWGRRPDVGRVGRAGRCRRWGSFCFRILHLGPTRLEPGSPKFGLPPMAPWATLCIIIALIAIFDTAVSFLRFLGVGFGIGVGAGVGIGADVGVGAGVGAGVGIGVGACSVVGVGDGAWAVSRGVWRLGGISYIWLSAIKVERAPYVGRIYLGANNLTCYAHIYANSDRLYSI